MKKLATIMVLLLLATAIFAPAPGWSQECKQSISGTSASTVRVLTATCTAGADGTFPSFTTETGTDIAYAINEMYLCEVRTNPGTTAPQALYDIVINDADGIDVMGGTLADRSATVSQRAIPQVATGVYGCVPVDGALTVVFSNNNVGAAQTVLKLVFER